MLLGILAVLFQPPTTCLQVIAFLMDPSLKTFGFAVLGALATQFSFGMGLVTMSLLRLQCVKRMLLRCAPAPLPKADIGELLPESARKDVQSMDFTLRFRKLRFWEGIHVFVAAPVPGMAASASLTAFLWQSGCMVFVPAMPTQWSGWQRFAILHELGHGARQAGVLQVHHGSLFEEYVFAAWMLFMAEWNLQTLTVCVLAAVIRYAVRCRWNLKGTSFKYILRDERHADQFAITHLKRDDLLEAHEVFKVYSFPDSRLSPADNDFRQRRRLRDIEEALERGSPKPYELPLFENLKRLVITNIIISVSVILPGQELSTWKGATLALLLLGGALIMLLQSGEMNNLAEGICRKWSAVPDAARVDA